MITIAVHAKVNDGTIYKENIFTIPIKTMHAPLMGAHDEELPSNRDFANIKKELKSIKNVYCEEKLLPIFKDDQIIIIYASKNGVNHLKEAVKSQYPDAIGVVDIEAIAVGPVDDVAAGVIDGDIQRLVVDVGKVDAAGADKDGFGRVEVASSCVAIPGAGTRERAVGASLP